MDQYSREFIAEKARLRAEVGPSGVEAETRVGEPARGRRGDGQRPRRVGASGERLRTMLGGRFLSSAA